MLISRKIFVEKFLEFVHELGKVFLSFSESVGLGIFFIITIIRSCFFGPIYIKNIIQQIISIGFLSIPIVAMTCFFSGAVLAIQSYSGFSNFAGESSISAIVILSITRELSPVMAGLMVSARSGAAMSAEIGTMRVSEQIDALFSLSIYPIRFIIIPRIIASIISLPFLVFLGDIIGVLGGYVVSIYKLGFNKANYIESSISYLKYSDVKLGLIKAFTFGFIFSIVSCYYGYFSSKGAMGVGNATTKGVVTSSILILTANYVITELMF
jgi:phospholipid/cholesterol/gamma-HCH transport system permease protein